MNKQCHLSISGMSCSACSARVERAAAALPGMRQVQVNLLTHSMRADFDPQQLSEEDIIAAVRAVGYGAAPALNSRRQSPDSRALCRRLLLSLAFLLPLVALHHLGQGTLSDWLQLLLCLPIVWLNRCFFISGGRKLLQAAPNMDSLVALGAGASLLYALIKLLLLHEGGLYLESAGMILSLITLGKYLEARATGRTGAALEKLMALLPETATLLREGTPVVVPAEAVRAGERVFVRPGDRIPVDGLVEEGHSAVDESALTGESLPVETYAGCEVSAGSINTTGTLTLRALRPRSQSMLSGIIRLVDEASATKAPISRMADRISGIFVPLVVGIALLTTLCWLLLGAGHAFALSCGIAVLVISCPCALGLATPVAIMVGMGKGAELGILFRNGAALEHAQECRCVVLDKTGTITTGQAQVTEILPLSNSMNADSLLRIALALESAGNHPLAAAVVKAAAGHSPGSLSDFRSEAGRGILGTVDGAPCAAGNAALMESLGVLLGRHTETAAKRAAEGRTPLFFAREGELIGMMTVADPIKPDSAAAIAELKQLGLRVVMMTGDNKATARAVAAQAGIDDLRAEALPQDKEAAIREMQSRGLRVAMVGDGINDAPALARADVGISLGGGTDIARENADLILVRNELSALPTAMRLSKAVIANIRMNLFWAFLYNALAIPLAAGLFHPLLGWGLHPGIAAAAMSLSSFCVVCNALRLRRFTPSEHPAQHPQKSMNTRITLHIDGMMCPHCERHVSEALSAIEGVTACRADHRNNCATLELSREVDENLLRQCVEKAGYVYRGQG